MMKIFLISFVILALSMLAMAIGVVCGRHTLRGSCGGLNAIEGLEAECTACDGCGEHQPEYGFGGQNVDPMPVRRCHAQRHNS